MNVWDGDNKKKLCQLHQYPTSIASLAFRYESGGSMLVSVITHFACFTYHVRSRDGGLLAIASSYTFEEGEKQNPPDDNVVLRRVNDAEVKPRPKVPPPTA